MVFPPYVTFPDDFTNKGMRKLLNFYAGIFYYDFKKYICKRSAPILIQHFLVFFPPAKVLFNCGDVGSFCSSE